MNLVVDIGNTDIVFGVKNSEWKTLRIPTGNAKLSKVNWADFADWLPSIGVKKINKTMVSSVVPELNDTMISLLRQQTSAPVYIIDKQSYDQLPIGVNNQDEIGTDLVCNSLTAHELFKCDCMVIDFGTALTFTVIIDQKIVGVNIAPGINTALKALTQNASQLGDIPLELPASVIGHNTTTAIQSGLLWGYVGLVEKMIDRIEKETGKPLKVAATGGLSHLLDPLKERFDVIDKHLTLEGTLLMANYY